MKKDFGDPGILWSQLYRFRNQKNTPMIIRVDCFEKDVFVIKFYPKKMAESPKRFSHLTNSGHVRKVLFTCEDVIKDVLTHFPKASFAFMGQPTESERIEKDFNRSKRFRVYNKFVTTFFDKSVFEHSFRPEFSTYILLNKKAGDVVQLNEYVADLFSPYVREAIS